MHPAAELVIFDCDGVLVDSEAISQEVLARTLTAAGAPTSTEEAWRIYQGLMLNDIVAVAEARHGVTLPADFLERFTTERAAEFERRLRPVTGAEQAVQRLRAAGLKVCVASQGRLVKTEHTLGLTGLRRLFDTGEIFSAYSVARGKPHPDLFLHAAEVMGTAPGASVVVEDSASGVQAGLAAGMRVIGYVGGGDGSALRALGVETLSAMAQLPVRLGLGAV